MMGRDRTREFLDLVQHSLVNARGASTDDPHISSLPCGPYEHPTDQEEVLETTTQNAFHTMAEDMGRRLNLMQKRIAQVEKSKRSNLFEDHGHEIQTATYEIRQWILEMNTQLDELENNIANRSATPKDSHCAAHYKSVIQALRSRLAETTARLKQLLELRAHNMKNQEERRRIYSHSSGSNSFFASQDDPEYGYTESEKARFMDASSSKTQLLSAKRLQPMYYSARAEAIQNIQSMIGELAQIFSRVASLVSAQEELSARIEDDMSSALYNIQQGEFQLTQYLKHTLSNRSLILKVDAAPLAS